MAHSNNVPQLKNVTHSKNDDKAIAYAKKGILLALLSGIVWGANSLLVDYSTIFPFFGDPQFKTLIPAMRVGINDTIAACVMICLNTFQGRSQEIWRSLFSKPGRYCIMGGMIGAILGMGCYMTAVQLAGPTYILPITSLYPAIGSLLAFIFLKERIKLLAWFGITLCILGIVIVAFKMPSTANTYFYMGLSIAFITAIGWGTEGVFVTYAMDFVEPAIALNIYYITSAILYWIFIIPSIATFGYAEYGGITLVGSILASKGFFYLAGVACIAPVSYLAWYKAMNMTGLSRAMALNISYALWGIVFATIFTKQDITVNLVIGACVIFLGMVLVIGHPRDLINLRKVE